MRLCRYMLRLFTGSPATAAIALAGLFLGPTPAWAEADLSLELSAGPAPALVGSPLLFTLAVDNGGPGAATEVLVTARLSAPGALVRATSSQGGCSPGDPVVCALGALAPGRRATIVVEVLPATAAAISLDAAVSSSLVDPAPGGNSASASVEAVVLSESADLSVSLRDRPDPVEEGDRVVYTAVVRNQGPAPATGASASLRVRPLELRSLDRVTTTAGRCATLSDSREPLEVNCDLGTLPPSATVTIEVAVFADVSNFTDLVAAVSVGSAVADPNPANNSDSEGTNVVDEDFFGLSEGLTCLVTSSVAGTPLARHLGTFRDFRDKYLLTNRAGRAFVGLYEEYSPPAARYVREHAPARAVVRGLLWIALGLINYPAQAVASLLIVYWAGWRLRMQAALRRV